MFYIVLVNILTASCVCVCFCILGIPINLKCLNSWHWPTPDILLASLLAINTQLKTDFFTCVGKAVLQSDQPAFQTHKLLYKFYLEILASILSFNVICIYKQA